MGLESVFKLSIYVLTGFVGLALGMAEFGPIPFISLPVTVFSYWWCEIGTRRGLFSEGGLGESPARVLGFLALLAASFEFFGESPEAKLLAGIHLMVYLTWVVLMQQKSNYRYWLLLTLGMMHVAVGSVLTNGAWYGLCMVIYMFGAIWTLSVFSLYRVAQEFEAIDPETDPAPVLNPDSTAMGQVFNSVRFENNAPWISMRLVSGVAATATSGLFVGVIFFALIPRVWVGAALGISDESLPPALRRNVTGQANEVRLGDIGQILESNDPVLNVRIFDNQTNREMDVQGYAEALGLDEPLFRGAVLTEYSDGRWRPERSWSTTPSQLAAKPGASGPANATIPTVRQEIHLERIGNEVLYCVGRPVAMRDPEGYRCGLILPNSIVVRRDWFARLPGAVDYIAYSQFPTPESRQDPGLIATSSEGVMYRVSNYVQRCTAVPEELSRLRELAQKLVDTEQQKQAAPLSDVQMARVLQTYLRDSGEFAYSLNATPPAVGSDPVEDFLFRHHSGHCQYFASALALMFRSVGIPARLVTGFKGGETVNGSLFVEKRYAHVWVEAWIDQRKWMTFDATPEDGRAQSVTAIGAKKNLWQTMTSKLAGMWETNVLDISPERQEDVIYQPMRDILSSLLKFVKEFWQSPLTSLVTIVILIGDPRNWMTVPGAIALTSLAGLLWMLRRKTTWFRWKRKLGTSLDDQRQRVEFYERFAGLMRAHGHIRQPSQTQDEFVREMYDALLPKLTDDALRQSLLPLGTLFYLVRFGAGELTIDEKAQLNGVLSRLEEQLSLAPHKEVQIH